MRLHVHAHEQASRRTAKHAGVALAGQLQQRAVIYAGGDGDLQALSRPFVADALAIGAGRRDAPALTAAHVTRRLGDELTEHRALRAADAAAAVAVAARLRLRARLSA